MIDLAVMSAADFDEYLQPMLKAYARDRARAEMLTLQQAENLARRQIEEMLPRGVATADHCVANIIDSDTDSAVGIVWYYLDREQKALFLCDIVIHSSYRRRGFGRRTVKLLEQKAHDIGCTQLRLHVFGHNTSAQRFWEHLGFITTNVHMSKKIDD